MWGGLLEQMSRKSQFRMSLLQIHMYNINTYARKTHLLMKVMAFDHKKRIERARIIPWQTKVSRWYSRSSNRIHIAVATPRAPADIFLFLHSNTSAAVSTKLNQEKVLQ